MTQRALAFLGLVLALPAAFAGDAAGNANRMLTRQVDDLLRGSGSKLFLEQDKPAGTVAAQVVDNRVIYHTRESDQRLVRIEIEPVGEERPGTSKLAASFLSALKATGSVEDGVKLAELLSSEFGKDGLTRSIALDNGMKFMKGKQGDANVRYIIQF